MVTGHALHNGTQGNCVVSGNNSVCQGVVEHFNVLQLNWNVFNIISTVLIQCSNNVITRTLKHRQGVHILLYTLYTVEHLKGNARS